MQIIVCLQDTLISAAGAPSDIFSNREALEQAGVGSHSHRPWHNYSGA